MTLKYINKKVFLLFIAFSIQFCFAMSSIQAAEPFKVSIAVLHHGKFVKPIGNVITMTDPYAPYEVIVKNISSLSQKLYSNSARGSGAITFEVYDEKGQRNLIEKKVYIPRSNMRTYQHMQSGGSRRFKIVFDEDEWENSFKFYKQGAKKLKARAIFNNGSNKIYSEYYEVHIK